MAEISAKDVMKLRNETGLAMMECKKALIECDGEIEAATEYLRKRLKGKMEKRTERAAGEGCISTATDGTSASIVEIRCETDFTAKNENFLAAAKKIAEIALNGNVGAVETNDEITAIIDDLRITTGENCSFARGNKCEGTEAAFGSYVHHDGKTGVLIHAVGSIDENTLRQLCMHITAAHPRPLGISTDDIPAEMVEKEKTFRLEQAMESGKPKEIAEMMVEGGMRKFFSEIALLEQPFVMDEKKKISEIVGDATLSSFFRWEVGEEV